MPKLFGGSETSTGFADRKALAASRQFFCIDDAKLFTQADGVSKWFLTILRGETDTVVETLTFSRSAKRDEGFQRLKEEGKFPVHNVWLEKREFKSKTTGMMQTYYDINFELGKQSCPCGGLGIKAETPF